MNKLITEPFLFSDHNQQFINTKEIKDLVELRPNELLQPHKVSFFAIHLFYKGKGKHSVDFTTFDIEENNILFISPNQIAQFYHPIEYNGKVLIFTEEFFCRNKVQTQFLGQTNLFNDPLQLSYFNVGNKLNELLSIFNFINEGLNRPHNEIQTSILNNYLFNILLIAEELYQPQNKMLITTPDKVLVSKFKSLVNKNINYQLPLQFYTDQLHVSLRTLEQAFNKNEKITPKKFVTDSLVMEIKRNLVFRENTISEIAFSLGFKEISNFTKFFKLKTGLTPSQFQKMFQIN
ncbi:helix-turn-helix domain-containing protein [Chryseobacterium defluvii]|uniref:AraC-like DNA-binding protein n=1 Tax=Chryseobacterium defluvii TaxID=160396 RepID=A0A495SQG4_9FLAO|nr:helix-turn-helix domain-containing protein [Chryseobacterium defluvii]RKT01742.1 AraC-like DNA-binding protein [Chryseobacterium defluvii]